MQGLKLKDEALIPTWLTYRGGGYITTNHKVVNPPGESEVGVIPPCIRLHLLHLHVNILLDGLDTSCSTTSNNCVARFDPLPGEMFDKGME